MLIRHKHSDAVAWAFLLICAGVTVGGWMQMGLFWLGFGEKHFNITWLLCVADKLIGVHCTHGLNRTGYLVCRWVVRKLSYVVASAASCCTSRTRVKWRVWSQAWEDLKLFSFEKIVVVALFIPNSSRPNADIPFWLVNRSSKAFPVNSFCIPANPSVFL